MKRYLLLWLMCVCLSIGALAQQSTVEAKYWYGDQLGTISEKVALVNNQPGGLAAAVATIGSDVTIRDYSLQLDKVRRSGYRPKRPLSFVKKNNTI